MDKCIDSLEDATLFSTLDENWGYWKVESDEKYRYKTALTSHHGQYCFIRIFRTLKRPMNVI